MQIFEAADPVWAAEHRLHTRAGDPAKMVGQTDAFKSLAMRSVNKRVELVALQPLPRQPAGAIQQHGIERRPAETPTHRTKVFDVVFLVEAFRGAGPGQCGGRCRSAFDVGGAEIKLETGYERAELPVVPNLSACQPAAQCLAGNGWQFSRRRSDNRDDERIVGPAIAAMRTDVESRPGRRCRIDRSV